MTEYLKYSALLLFELDTTQLKASPKPINLISGIGLAQRHLHKGGNEKNCLHSCCHQSATTVTFDQAHVHASEQNNNIHI